MKSITIKSKQGILSFLLLLLLSVLILLAPKFPTPLKIIYIILLLYYVNNLQNSICFEKGRVLILKRKIFAQEKEINVVDVKQINIELFHDKGGYGYKLIIDTNFKYFFITVDDTEILETDLVVLKKYIKENYPHVKLIAMEKWV